MLAMGLDLFLYLCKLALEPDLPLGLNVDIKMDLKWAMDIKLNLSLVLEWI